MINNKNLLKNMKRILNITIVILCISFISLNIIKNFNFSKSYNKDKDAKIKIEVFSLPNCKYCDFLKNNVLTEIKKQYGKQVSIDILDKEKNIQKYNKYMSNFKDIPENFKNVVPITIISTNNNQYLIIGYNESMKTELPKKIKKMLNEEKITSQNFKIYQKF